MRDALAKLPAHLQPGLLAYIEEGRETGDFLAAVLANSLFSAVCRADAASLAALRPIMLFLYDDAPGACWGSPGKVRAWIERGGQAGISREAEAA